MAAMIRLTRQQSRVIDHLAAERYHIPTIVLMENAARAIVDVAGDMAPPGSEVLICCGGGNNGGDGLAAARHLHNRGYPVRIILTADPTKYTGDALINWRIVDAMKLPAAEADVEALAAQRPALLIDAIFGTGLTQPPRPPFVEIVKAIEATGAPVLAVDIPSGLDCNTGKPLGDACIRAKRTVTFVAEKIGYANQDAAQFVGRIVVGDIGCPASLIQEALALH